MKKEQQRSFPTNLDEKLDKQDVEHTKAFTLMSGRKFEKPTIVEVDVNELEELVSKEEESTSPKINEIREEIVEYSRDDSLGEVYKELED